MGLFDQILSAVNNPNQQASPDQLGAILNTVQQLSNRQGLNPSTTQTAMSVVGSYVRSALQQQRNAGGNARAEAIVNQYGGTSPSLGALDALFSPAQQRQVADAVAQRTGISADQVIALLPILVPIVLNLLKQGSTTRTANAPTANTTGSNSVLDSFLDADGDGDVDVGDAMSLAGRFLNQR
ncbi:DUF937 domain-containing protein [Leptolyngbya sp. NK1-12]|uniref:DUF937 domain-containing protein n=1 Tax=Leptolyngbya sp. NK1-12 TaxID=2547451 RepID=A0AA97AEE2_9CYAN|nr:DUF937 domain-containing protein [Leptolyngbya sp. NK1-12]